ncbi:hypothetical protein [Legionella sp. 29fVS95]|uniref:hypothetical protein n=1 Tax=Legionella sp. 29fVS95 TaxID=3402813 RepID=UPI003AF83C25
MASKSNLPPIVILSRSSSSSGQILSQDSEGGNLALGMSESFVYIPIILVEQSLVTPDYELYLFNDYENLSEKIDEIIKTGRDAIILLGSGKERVAYFIEDKGLVSSTPSPIRYGFDVEKLNLLQLDDKQKVDRANNDLVTVRGIIRQLRLQSGRGNEVEVNGTRTGHHVFSQSFGPCNPVLARRKKDNQFVLHHADSSSVDDTGGIGAFLQSVKLGEGAQGVFVVQNPKVKRNVVKAPLIAGGIAVQLQDQSVKRINLPEGFTAIACINGNTVILANKLVVFHGNAEKEKLLQDLSEAQSSMEKSREINSHAGPDIIALSQTLKDVVTVNGEMKKKLNDKEDPYKDLINNLKELGIGEKTTEKKSIFQRLLKL